MRIHGAFGKLVVTGLGLLGDRTFGDPSNTYHPVAHFGQVMTVVGDLFWTDSFLGGLVVEVIGVGAAALVGGGVGGSLWGSITMASLCIGERQLHEIALSVARALDEGDLVLARARCAQIVGRDLTEGSAEEVCRAAIESVAENTVDAVLAPVLYGVVFGVMGSCVYRAINTLDAMYGHKSAEYLRFGMVIARIDDMANFLIARLGALGVWSITPQPRRSEIVGALSDAKHHPSPNGGVIEAAFAGALGVRLGGINRYQGTEEHRGVLGGGGAPVSGDIHRAVALSRRLTSSMFGVIAAAVVAQLLVREIPRRNRRGH